MSVLQYLFYPPAGDAAAEAYPLIIFLHGAGERGTDLERVKRWGLPPYLEQGNTLPAYVAAPQCPSETMRWENLLDELESLLDQLLNAYPVDPDRVLLTGFSMGSFGTWQWALRSPQRFAALMPVGGHGFKHNRYFKDEDLCELKEKPIWMIHGAQDEVVPVSGADEFAGILATCGANFGYTRYPHANHVETATLAFSDKAHYEWLFSRNGRGTHDNTNLSKCRSDSGIV